MKRKKMIKYLMACSIDRNEAVFYADCCGSNLSHAEAQFFIVNFPGFLKEYGLPVPKSKNRVLGRRELAQATRDNPHFLYAVPIRDGAPCYDAGLWRIFYGQDFFPEDPRFCDMTKYGTGFVSYRRRPYEATDDR